MDVGVALCKWVDEVVGRTSALVNNDVTVVISVAGKVCTDPGSCDTSYVLTLVANNELGIVVPSPPKWVWSIVPAIVPYVYEVWSSVYSDPGGVGSGGGVCKTLWSSKGEGRGVESSPWYRFFSAPNKRTPRSYHKEISHNIT